MEKKTKRGHGEGSFRLTRSGKWEGAIWVAQVGRRVFVTAETEAKARKRLRDRVALITSGQAVARQANVTFRSYAEQVIREREGIGQRTRDKYTFELGRYLVPLRDIRVDKVTPAMLRSLYAGMRERGLSVTVRGHVHTLIRLVLEAARVDGKIAQNPADQPGVRPRPERGAAGQPVKAFAPQQAARIVHHASQVLHGELIRLLLMTGLRRGEAMALRRSDVDLASKKITVRMSRSVSNSDVYEGAPKTARSRRTLTMTDETVQLVTELNALNDERHQALYRHLAAPTYLFTGITGTALRPDNVRQILHKIYDRIDLEDEQLARRAGLVSAFTPTFPRLSIHSLRHTFVSLMAAQGMRLEVIAEWIGDDPATVMKVYLHVFRADTAMPELQLPSIAELPESMIL